MQEKPKSEEARDLVREAEEARQAGDRDEAAFLIDAAKELDPQAAKEAQKTAVRPESKK